MKMNKKTRKHLITAGVSTLVVGSVVTGIALATTLGITSSNNSYVAFVTPEQTIVLDNTEVQTLEAQAYEASLEQQKAYNISTFADENGDGIDDDTGEPIDDGSTDSDGDGIPDSEEGTEDSGTESTTEIAAKWIQIGFFSAALTGDYDYIFKNTDSDVNNDVTVAADGFILNPATDSTWLAPNITDVDVLTDTAIDVKIFNDTTGASTTVWQYIGTLAGTDLGVAQACGIYQDPTIDNIFDMKDPNGDTVSDATETANFVACTNELVTNDDFLLSTMNFLYTYSYFWQADSTTNYDFILTKLLVQYKPAFIWKADVTEDFNNGQPYNELQGESITSTDAVDLNWSDLADDNNVTINQDATLTNEAWDIGFNGIEYKNNTTTITNGDLWLTTSAYNYNNVNGVDYTTYDPNGYGINTASAPMIYEENGEVLIKAEGSTGITGGQIISPVLIYPFVYGVDYDPADENASQWNYSIYAAQADGSTLTEAEWNANTADNQTSIQFVQPTDAQMEDEMDANGSDYVISIFDILSWELGATSSYLNANYIEMLVTYDLFIETSASLQNTVYSYWNSKGFYIELSGDYYDKYSPFINVNLLKKE